MNGPAIPAPGALDAATVALLEDLAGAPESRPARALIVAAVIADGRAHAGIVDPNRVREALAEQVVPPTLVGAVYGQLVARKVMEFVGWTTSTDVRGHNCGKPARRYRLTDGWRT